MQGCVTLVFIFSPAAVTSSPAAVTSRCARDQLGRGIRPPPRARGSQLLARWAALGRQPQGRAQPQVRARPRARLLGRQPRVRARPPVASPFVQVRRAMSPVLPFSLANLGDGVRLLLVRGEPSAVAAVGEVGLILDGA